jgi:hypothetical protein
LEEMALGPGKVVLDLREMPLGVSEVGLGLSDTSVLLRREWRI